MPKFTLLHWDPGSQHLESPLWPLLLWAKSWRSCVSPLGLSCAQSQALPFSLLEGGPWGPIRLHSGQVTHPPFPWKTSLIYFPVTTCLLLPHLLPRVFWHNFLIFTKGTCLLALHTWNVRTKARELLNIKLEAHDKSIAGHLLPPEAIHCTCPTATKLLIKLS